ncbi:fumarylacetoacetate hydrolase family protein [Pinisolibacter sp.]|uniref:fumarylacetoacetate hydrolase family protein n=1 Tax=Pinisolibacter sp. TaxID=2172024 RepID=UPI002FDDB008
MRICRYENNRIGLVRGDRVHDVSHLTGRLGTFGHPLPRHDLLVAGLAELAPELARFEPTDEGTPIGSVRFESPVANPGKIVAAPVNYRKHFDEAAADPVTFPSVHVRSIAESGLFLKATSSVVGPAAGVTRRFADRRTDHEVELAVVIGRECSFVPEKDALSVVAGYCIGLDMTLRGSEDRSFRKSPDGYTVLGPWLVTADEVGDPSALDLSLAVGGEIRQHANTRDLIFGVPRLIALASSFFTLHPGDVILTGTPEGVGEVLPGDVVTASIARIGVLETRVR